MNQHVMEWLAAYFDGELHGMRLQKVEEHLWTCSACQLELEQLQGLSTLLKDCPPMTTHMSHEQFAAQVGLRLPRSTPEHNGLTWQRGVNIGWLSIPLSIILGWALSQTASLIISVIQGLGVNLSWMSWFSSLFQWINSYSFWSLIDLDFWDTMRDAVPWLDWGEMLVHTIAPYLTITVVTAISLWCWMVCWWVLHQRKRQQIHPVL